MSRHFKAISIEEYPKQFVEGYGTNCFAFALGITEPVRKHLLTYDLNSSLSIDLAFMRKVEELGFGSIPRKIISVDDAKPNEYVFLVFDFTYYNTNVFGMEVTLMDFHIVRRELDGSWVHKPGWDENPCKLEEADWTGIFREFGNKYVLFALQEENVV